MYVDSFQLCEHVFTRVQVGSETRKTFLRMPSAIELVDEETGVEHLLRDIKNYLMYSKFFCELISNW